MGAGQVGGSLARGVELGLAASRCCPINNNGCFIPRAMTTKSTTNKCHHCGATSYKPVIKRDASGSMKPSGQYQCAGCGLAFGSIDEWRTGINMLKQGGDKPLSMATGTLDGTHDE